VARQCARTSERALTNAGAIPRFVGPRVGSFRTAEGDLIEADTSMENSPPVLFDGLVLPDGKAATTLAMDRHRERESDPPIV
jgi:catalase